MLWIFVAVTGVADVVLWLMEPTVIEQVIAGGIEGTKIGPEVLVVFAILFLIPLVMAFLSLTLRDSINRWVNIILGLSLIGFGLVDLAATANPSAHEALMMLSSWVTLALIIWYVWKSKQKVRVSQTSS